MSDLHTLLTVEESLRDAEWEKSFLEAFPKAYVSLLNETPESGPDHFPYLLVETSEKAAEPVMDVLKWLSERGIGLVLNPSKEYPDYIFSYGMIWYFIQTGSFVSTEVPAEISDGTQLFVGTPSEAYLPKSVRSLIRQFLNDQGIMKPKITMLSQDQKNFDLCFSIESFGSPKDEEHAGILQALAWFLPNHYSLAMVSEEKISEFVEL